MNIFSHKMPAAWKCLKKYCLSNMNIYWINFYLNVTGKWLFYFISVFSLECLKNVWVCICVRHFRIRYLLVSGDDGVVLWMMFQAQTKLLVSVSWMQNAWMGRYWGQTAPSQELPEHYWKQIWTILGNWTTDFPFLFDSWCLSHENVFFHPVQCSGVTQGRNLLSKRYSLCNYMVKITVIPRLTWTG